MLVQITDSSGLAVVRDSRLAPPRVEGEHRSDRGPIRALATSGKLFFVDGEDPLVNLRLEVLLNEPASEAPASLFEPAGGSFLLQVPSGRLAVSGYDAWESGDPAEEASLDVPPGAYAGHVLSRDEFNPKRYEAAMKAHVGEIEWQHLNAIDRLYFLGCLPTVIAMVALFLPFTRTYTASILAVVALAWLPFLILSRTRRYRRTRSQRKAFDRSLPAYILQLRPVRDTGGLSGGSITTATGGRG